MRHGSLWRLAPDKATLTIDWTASPNVSGSTPTLAMDDAGRRLLVATTDQLEILEFAGGDPIRRTLYRHSDLGKSAISGNGRFAALTVDKERILVWDLEAPASAPRAIALVVPEGNLRIFWEGPTDLAVSNDGRLLAAGTDYSFGPSSLDATITLWRMEQGVASVPITLKGSRGHVWISPDSNAIVTGGYSPMLWTLDGQRIPLPTPLASGHGLERAQFTSDATRLALGYGDRQVAVWSKHEDASWRQVGTNLRGLESAATSLSVDRAGERMAIGERRGSLRLWRLDRLPDQQGVRTLAMVQSIGDGVYHPEVGRRGEWILARGAVERERFGAELWKREGDTYRRALVRPLLSDLFVPAAELSPDERYFVTVDAGAAGWDVRLLALDDKLSETRLATLPAGG